MRLGKRTSDTPPNSPEKKCTERVIGFGAFTRTTEDLFDAFGFGLSLTFDYSDVWQKLVVVVSYQLTLGGRE